MAPADLLVNWVDRVGVTKVVAIVTDNCAALKKARQEVVQQEGYEHIMELR